MSIEAEALKESIKHWERMRDGTYAEDEHTGSDDCACCNHWFWGDPVCSGCPIAAYEGSVFCRNTPYDSISSYVRDYRSTSTFRSLAAVEVRFLREVLCWVEQGGMES